MASYAHTVADPTATIASLQEQIRSLKCVTESVFDKPMSESLERLENADTKARTKDTHAALDGRLTGAKLLVSAAYVYLDVIWGMLIHLTQCI